MLSSLFSNPILFAVWMIAILYGLTIHEFAHALVAFWQGDSTAKDAGRLTLNPIAHIDFFGLMMLIIVGFGWGRPVPVDLNKFKKGKASDNLVSLAGIAFNLASFVLFAVILKALVIYGSFGENNLLIIFITYLMLINLILAVFNILPIPPLDGSHILFNILPDRFNNFKLNLLQNGPFILLIALLADNFLNLHIFSSIFGFFIKLVYLVLD